MRNILHFYYQNRKKVWTIILVIVIIIGLIRLLNYIVGHKSPDSNNNIYQDNNIIKDINGNSSTNAIISSNNSLVDGGKISSSTLKSAKDTIESFINYCNNGELEQAYNLLTDECKEELYPTLEIFRENYWKGFFEKQRICVIENWTSNTYKITITEDMLTTGNSINKNSYIDYVTIVKSENSYKLNINNYIGSTEINRSTEKNDIEMKVLRKNTYMDYETYEIQVNNKSKNNIILDNLEQSDTIYLQDSKDIKYIAQNYKLQNNDMMINSGVKKNVEITFSNGYTTSRKLKYLVFSKLISNNIDKQTTYAFYINL